jgi:hypothetical protein
LLNCRDHLRLHYVLQIWKQKDLEEAEKPEPGTEQRTVKVLKSTKRLELTEAGIKVFRTVIRISSK